MEAIDVNEKLLLSCWRHWFVGIVLGRHTGQVDGTSSALTSELHTKYLINKYDPLS
jgi:hypothetical protein